jgi:hypothetical protein
MPASSSLIRHVVAGSVGSDTVHPSRSSGV